MIALFVTAGVSFAQSNNAALNQAGDDNIATIEQSMATESQAEVSQEGDLNSSIIEQSGEQNNASLSNVGDENIAYQVQDGAGNQQRIELWGDGNTYNAEQFGDENFIYLNARGTGPGLFGRADNGGNNNDNEANIVQSGDNNMFTGAITGSNNQVDAEQNGNGNQIGGALISGSPVAPMASYNTGALDFIASLLFGNAWSGNGVNVYGDGNEVDITQSGNYNTGFAFVEGNDNLTQQYLTDSNGNNAIQAVIGSDNRSVIEAAGNYNTLLSAQLGYGNDLFLNARDNGSEYGGNSNNTFAGLQLGEDNLISAGINGTNNTLLIGQLGSNNAVGTGFYATDGANINGHYNTVQISQLGDANMATVGVVGNGNMTTVAQ